jgi:hypothetical protein
LPAIGSLHSSANTTHPALVRPPAPSTRVEIIQATFRPRCDRSSSQYDASDIAPVEQAVGVFFGGTSSE